MVLLLPLKSNRCASSFCACWMAFETSCISVLETTSNENSWAISLSSLCGDHCYAGRRRKAEQLGRRSAAMIAGEFEERAISLAVGVFEPIDQMRRRVDGQRRAANRGGRGARLQGHNDRRSAIRFAYGEEPLARRGLADEQERQFGLTLVVDRTDGHLLVRRHVEPRVRAVEDEQLFLGPAVRPAHLRRLAEEHRAALDLAVLESLRCESLRE